MIIDDALGTKLLKLGVITEEGDDSRKENYGTSNYSKRTLQPWSIIIDWNLDFWRADILKRIADRGKGEDPELDILKIKDDCDELLRQIRVNKKLKQDEINLGE